MTKDRRPESRLQSPEHNSVQAQTSARVKDQGLELRVKPWASLTQLTA